MNLNWALRIAARYAIEGGIAYRQREGLDVKLDVYYPREKVHPRPAFLFMHGGGWAPEAARGTASLWFLPFLQLGWVVVNVGYRSSMVPAPAAVQDCLHALSWTTLHAEQYGIDVRKIVLGGLSAGGHLALMAGMLSSAIERNRSALVPLGLGELAQPIRPAAIVNWCGITDVADLSEGPHRQEFAVRWLGDPPNRLVLAKAVSPLTYVGAGAPPVVTVHGDQDEIVPYSHAMRLHEGLAQARVVNELITLPGAVHASYEAYLNQYPRILEFLARLGLPTEGE